MKKQLLLIISSLAGMVMCGELSGQNTGINTQDPQAILDVEASDGINPTGEDGIIIPRVTSLPSSGSVKGQLIYLVEPDNEDDRFYYWSNTEWIAMPPFGTINYEQDQTCYAFVGEGDTGTGAEREVNLTDVYSVNPDFTVTNNQITTGKAGLYLIRLTANAKKFASSNGQTNIELQVYLNGVAEPNLRVMASTSFESTASTSLVFAGMQRLEVGDTIEVRYTADDDGVNVIGEHNLFGVNSLTLFFLRE